MARKKMTEAEKKAWKAKMDAAKRRKRGPTMAETIKALGGSKSRPPRSRSRGARGTTAITLVKSSDGSYSFPLLPSGSPSSSSIVLASQGALASVKRGSGLAIRKAREVLEGVLEEPKKKTRRKPAKKAEVVKKPKRRRSGLTGDIRKGKPAKPKKPKKPKTRSAKSGSAPKRKAMSARARLVCYPIGSGSSALLVGGRKTSKSGRKTKRKSPRKTVRKSAPKKTASKAPKRGRRKASKPSAALATTRGEFVFPHAPGGERACTKCGRLHSKREHWSHKLMHGTKKTQYNYECARGGKCVFKRLASKKERAEALRIESERTKDPRRQAALALQYYQLIGRAGRGSKYSFGAESSKVTPERAARRRIIPAADPYERERREKEAEELAELEQAAEARAEGRLNRQWSRRY